MDRLLINRDFDAFCGTGIAFDYAYKALKKLLHMENKGLSKAMQMLNQTNNGF